MRDLKFIILTLIVFAFSMAAAPQTYALPSTQAIAETQSSATLVQRRGCRIVEVKTCKKRWIGQKCRVRREEVCGRGRDRDRDFRGRGDRDDDDYDGRRRRDR